MTTPVVSNFLFEEDDGGLMGAKTCYVQTISFPGSHLWIWIGDKSAGAPNLSLAMGSRNGPANQVLSTNGKYRLQYLGGSESHIHNYPVLHPTTTLEFFL